MEANHRLNIQNLREKENAKERDIKRLHEEQKTLNDHIMNFKHEIEELQEQNHIANETIIIKESEVCRKNKELFLHSQQSLLSNCIKCVKIRPDVP